ncbi:Uncharacterised protein [Mycobacterium tuberculosis]|nr:Uncharacterised protein [Mycobacterium tuberculosis]
MRVSISVSRPSRPACAAVEAPLVAAAAVAISLASRASSVIAAIFSAATRAASSRSW